MPFLVLLLLSLAFIQDKWPAPPDWLSPLGSVLTTWLGVAALTGIAGVVVHDFRRRLQQQPESTRRLLRWQSVWRRGHVVTLVLFYLLAAYLFGWGWTVKHYLTYGRWSVPGGELLILLPFLAGLFLSWARFYDIELAIHHALHAGASPGSDGPASAAEALPYLSRWAYVGLQARQCLILAVPPFALLVIQQTVFLLYPPLKDDPVFMPCLSGTLLALLFVGWPWLLRLLLNLRPMPACPLRDRLEAVARRLRFRHSDILIWNTHDTLATAMLAGPLPVLRYVVFTDRLIANMEAEEVEAVFGHEVGHVKCHHMPCYLAFLVLSLLVLSAAADLATGWLPAEFVDWCADLLPWPEWCLELLAAAPLLALLLGYFFLVFGLLSRRCEREADLYAARATSGQAFLAALERVARLNGISKERPGWLASWRHDTIARRLESVRRACDRPQDDAAYQREIQIVKWGLLATLACLLLALAPWVHWDFLP